MAVAGRLRGDDFTPQVWRLFDEPTDHDIRSVWERVPLGKVLFTPY